MLAGLVPSRVELGLLAGARKKEPSPFCLKKNKREGFSCLNLTSKGKHRKIYYRPQL